MWILPCSYRNGTTTATLDEEYSRLALAIKDGGTMYYKIAYKSLLAVMKGISDSTHNAL